MIKGPYHIGDLGRGVFIYIAGALRDFLGRTYGRTYYPSKGKVAGKAYAAFAVGREQRRDRP